MNTLRLPSAMQNSTTSTDTVQKVRNFAGNVSTIQNPVSGNRQRVKWYFVNLVLILAMLLGFSNKGQGQSTGLLSPTSSIVTSGSVTTIANGYSSDNQYAVFTTNGDAALYGGFNFSIPAGSSILGIQVQLEGRIDNGGSRDLNISLTWNNGTTYSTEQAMTRFGTLDALRTVGGVINTWGHTWNLTEINNTNFGVRCRVPGSAQGNANLDHVQVIVYYDGPGQKTITSTGSFVVPAGITSITVQAWGGGAGGGTANSRGNGGGGGGAFAQSTFSVTPTQSYSVTVGAGGAANAVGGPSSFATTVVAAGGSTGASNGNGGPGGTLAGSTGTITRAGGNGGNGNTSSNGGGGGGGSSASSTPATGVNGTNASFSNGGAGGDGADGDGGVGQTNNGTAAGNGTIPGGGGGGNADNSGTNAFGAQGLVIIKWTPPSESSDIVLLGGYPYTNNIPYATYQAAASLTDATSVGAMGLTLRDGGSSSPDADANPTTLTGITFSTGGSTAIRTAALFDGTSNVKEVGVNGATSFAFTGLSLTALDNATKNFELRVTYEAAVTDNQQITYSVSSVTAGTGSGFAALNGGAATSTSTGDNNKIEVTATQLLFGTQPSTVNAGVVMAPAVTVVAEDVLHNTDLDFAGTVGLTTNSAFSLTATASVSAVSGVATFNNLVFTLPGTLRTLTTTSSLTNATSNTFIVNAGAPSQLVFTIQPGGGTGGIAWTTQPVVTLQDQFGNTVTGSAQDVTLEIHINAGPGGILSGTKTVAVNTSTGLAVFGGLSIDKAGLAYSLTATGSTVSMTPGDVLSSFFEIAVGPAAKLAFTVQPSGGKAGDIWAIQPEVTVQDAGGNKVVTAHDDITLAIGTNPTPGSILTVTPNPVTAINGVAAFTGASIDLNGNGYTLTANATGFPEGISAPFNIAGLATKYLVTSSSYSPIAGSTITITAQLADENSNPVGGSGKIVTWSKTGTGGTFANPTSTTDINGVATVEFTTSTLVADGIISITGTDGDLLTGTSPDITPIHGPATQILLNAGDSQSAVAGSAVPIAPSVIVKDINNNPVNGFSITFDAITGGGSVIGGSATTNSLGIASVVSWTLGIAAGTNTITAVSAELPGSTVTFTASGLVGAASKYIVTSDNNSPVAGSAVTITAQLTDISNNPVNTAGLEVTWSSTGTGGSFANATSTTDANGIATIVFTTNTGTGTVHTVTATDGGSLTGVTGNLTTISGPASKLSIVTITSPKTAGSAFSVTVHSTDANGNPANVTTDSNISLVRNQGTGVLSGTTTGTILSGTTSITINNVIYNRAEDVSITASQTSGTPELSPVTSNTFTVNGFTTSGTTQYRSIKTGNWSSTDTWEAFNGTNWYAPDAAPSSAKGTITIIGGHVVTVDADVTIDQTSVNSTGEILVGSGITMSVANPTGTDLTIDGTLSVNGTVSNAGSFGGTGTTTFNSNSTYIHNQDGNVVPTALWNSTSTCQIILASNDPTGLGQTFGNFLWAPTNQGSNNVDLASGFKCAGNLTISPTNSPSGTLRLNNGSSDLSVEVLGNFNQTAGNFVVVSGSGAGTLRVTGNLSITGGAFILKEDNGSAALNVSGNFNQSAGSFAFRSTISSGTAVVTVSNDFNLSNTADFNMATFSGTGTLNVAGNFSHTGGTITETSFGSGAIVFNKTGVQTYTSGGTVSNSINFTVNSGSTLQMASATTAITGGGTFTLSDGASLGITSTAGITSSGATGNIQVSGTRSYSALASYIYNGTGGAQVTGNGLPANVDYLTISNAAGVTFTSQETIKYNLVISAGSKANLGTNYTHTARTLQLGSFGATLGSWGSSSSTATYKNDTYFLPASGIVNITESSCTEPTINVPSSVCTTRTIQLTGSGEPYFMNPWVSETPGIASVNSSGLVTGIAEGIVVIRYTESGGCYKTATVIVNTLPAVTLGTISSICTGSESFLIPYTSTGNPDQYSITVNGVTTSGALTGSPISVSIAPASGTSIPFTLTVSNSTSGCDPNTLVSAVNVTSSGLWKGGATGAETDWNTADNWCGGVPLATTNVEIPSGIYQPVISSAAVCNSITINSGAILTINGANTLTVSGNWNNNGTLTANSGTVIFNGPAQNIANGSFTNITLTGTGIKSLSGVTVNGILSMEGLATVSGAPVYGVNASLHYNKVIDFMNLFTSGDEWIPNFSAGGGIVIMQGFVYISGPKVINAPFIINGGQFFSTNSDYSTWYDLTFGGNFINNGGVINLYTSNINITGAGNQVINGFSTTGNVSITKTGGIATFTDNPLSQGNVDATSLIINGTGELNLGASLTHTFSTATLTSGILNGGSSTLNINTSGSVWNGNGSVFAPGTGTVNFNAAGDQTLSASATTFNNIIFAGSGTKTLTSATTVNGNLNITSVTLAGGTGLTHNVKGNWINNGTFTAGTSTINFNGSMAQSLSGTASTLFNNLTISNSGTGVTLGNSETVNGTLTLSSGLLTLGVHNLTLGSAAVAGTPGTSSMIVTNGSGELRRVFTGNESYTFPVGDATGTAEYSPITLNFTSGAYSNAWAAVRVINEKHPAIAASSTNYLSRYWTVTSTGITGFSCNLTGTFNPADVTGNVANMVTGQWSGAEPWKNVGPVTASTITGTGITSFSDFTGIEPTAPPVITSPICADATIVSGTSTEIDGSVIEVFVNTESAGTTTVSGQAWSKSVSALTSGQSITANGLTEGKSKSAVSNTVVVATSAAPVITSPICVGATSVHGTSSEADNTVIEVFVNNESIGTTMVAGGSWTMSVSAMASSDEVNAFATAPAKCISSVSNTVIVATTAAPVINSPICVDATSVIGISTEGDGTIIEIFVNSASKGTTAVSGGSWTMSVPALASSDEVSAIATATDKCTSAVSNKVIVATTSAPVITSPICVGATSVTGISTEGDGTVIEIFVNSVSKGTTEVIGGSWTMSVLALSSLDEVTAKATATAKCTSAVSSTVIVATTSAPVINLPICVGATSVNGTSEANALIALYKAGTTSIGTVTADGSGDWVITVDALNADDVITATAKSIDKCISAVSNSVIVATTATPVITSPICVGATSVNGTSEANALITLYKAGTTSIGTVTAAGSGDWVITVDALNADDVITATAKSIDKCISGVSNPVIVATTAAPFITSPICVGVTSVSGTSTEADGTVIDVFVNNVSIGTTLLSGGNWTKTGLTFTSGQAVTAYATATDKCVSISSNSVTVQSVTATPVIAASSLCYGSSAISGTSETGATIIVYAGSVQIGTGTADAGGIWSITVSPAFVTGDVITATAQAFDKCVSLISSSKTVNPIPVPAIGANTPLCEGAKLSLTSGGGVSYLWSGPNSFSSTLRNPSITNVSSINTGTYKVVVTDINGCSAEITKDVLVNNVLDLTASSLSPVCEGSVLTLNATEGGTTYTWTSPNNESFITSIGQLIIPAAKIDYNGSWEVAVTVNSCGTTYSSTAVVIYPRPVISISGPAELCVFSTGNRYFTTAGMTNYSWNVSAGGTISAVDGSGGSMVDVTWTTAATDHWVSVNYFADHGDGNLCDAAAPTTYPVIVKPLSVPTILGLPTACQSSVVTYSTETSMNNYIWEVSSGGVITAGGELTDNTVSVRWDNSGAQTVKVKYTNGCPSADFTTLNVTVDPLPVAAGTIDGSATVCQGQSEVTYSVPAITNATSYVWLLPSGATGTSETNTITVAYNASAVSGNITVHGHNICGDGTSSSFPVTISLLPADPGIISGDESVCQGQQSVTYTVPQITDADTYIWTLPSGATGTSTTNSITINYDADALSGNVTVKGNNTCGDGNLSTLAITVNPLPVAAGTISGLATVCQGLSTVSYTVPEIANADSYIWNLPSGAIGSSNTNTITVDYSRTAFAGNITVKGHNNCGDGVVSSLTVAVNPLPDAAGTITGNATVCQGQTTSVTYSIAAIPNATAYVWTVPTGATITSGGATTIVVKYSATALPGNITVKGQNSCGDGLASTLPVTVNPAPVPTVSGPALVYVSATGNAFTTEGSNGEKNFTWIVSTGGSITSSTPYTNTVNVKWAIPGEHSVRVYYTNSNGCRSVTYGNLDVVVDPLLSSTPNPTTYGQTTALKATVSSTVTGDGLTAATGTVTFMEGSTALGAPVALSSGTATLNISSLSVGSHNIKAEYSGDNYSAATSNQITHVVNPASLTVTSNDDSKIYNGVTGYTGGNGVEYNGFVNGETTASLSGSLTYGGNSQGAIDKGTYEIMPGGLSSSNYNINFVPGTLTIDPKELKVWANASDKTYDGTKSATVEFTTDKVGSDEVTVNYTLAEFENPDVANGINVTVSGISISGADAVNYTLFNTTALTSASITRKDLHVINASVTGKQYDGITDAAITGATLDGVVAGDIANVTLGNATTGIFALSTPGTHAVATSPMTITGTRAFNYTLVQPALTGEISGKELAIAGSFIAGNKIYDANITAVLLSNSLDLSGVVNNEDVSLANVVVEFADKFVHTSKVVSIVSGDLIGSDAWKYSLLLTGSPTATADITAKELTVNGAVADDKAYDGTQNATISGASLSGVIGTDDVSLDALVGTFAQSTTGTDISVTAALTLKGADALNYYLTQPTGLVADITGRVLTVTGATADNKTYDGNTSATISGATLVGVVDGDDVSLDALLGTFAIATVDNNISVTAALTITGANAGRYTLIQPTGLTADINPIALTVTGITANDKPYDGTTVATLATTGYALHDIISSEDVTLDATGYTANFNNKDKGVDKPVTVSGLALSGTAAGNYTLTQPTGLTASIVMTALTVTGISANDKPYDGSTEATLNTTGYSLDGVSAGDEVTLDATLYTASFNTRDKGIGKPVTVSGLALSGAAAGNYTLTQPTGLTADINARALTVTGISANDKPYDGTTDATLTTTDYVIDGIVSSENVTLDASLYTASFNTRDKGIAKPVTVSGLALSGTAAGNYTLTQPTGLTADINAKALTVTGISANDKPYDGNTDATLTTTGYALHDIISSEDVTLDATGYTANFNTKDKGIDKPVTVSGLALSGTAAGNYTLTQPTGLTASIGMTALTVTGITANDRLYDGTTVATLTTTGYSLNGVSEGDEVTLDATLYTASFNTRDKGIGKPVTVSGLALSGAAAGNYTLTQPTGLTADINAKALTVTGISANDKPYDGTTVATLATIGYALHDIISSEDVTLDATGYTANFNTKDKGVDKPVTVSGLALSGTAAGNYTLIQPTGLAAAINARELTVNSAVAESKIYDGTVEATISGSVLAGIVEGENVSLDALAGTFAQATIGTDIPVTAALTIKGADIGNYTIVQPSGLKANIDKKPLTVINAGVTARPYDGTTNAVITGAELFGVVTGDVPYVILENSTSGTFASEIVGTHNVTTAMTISGTKAANYSLVQPSLIGNITSKVLIVTATGVNKIYDGTVVATVTLSTNKVEGDEVTASYTSAEFVDKNIGTGKTVNVNGITLSGADANNYSFNNTATTTADITPKGIKITDIKIYPQSRAYDGTDIAVITRVEIVSGLEGNDDVEAGSLGGLFDNKNVGVGKLVTATVEIKGGADAANYYLIETTATDYADITPAQITVVLFTAYDKEYDGTNVATVRNLMLNGIWGNDNVYAVGAAATFSSANIGTWPVTLTNVNLSGNDASNYSISVVGVPNATASITARTLTIAVKTLYKAYGSAYTFETANTGKDYTVTGLQQGDVVSGITLTSAGASPTATTGSYQVFAGNATGTGLNNYLIKYLSDYMYVTAKELTITAKDQVKIYGSVFAFNVAYPYGDFTVEGLEPADAVSRITLTSTGAAATALVSGTPYTITPDAATGFGLDNYHITYITGKMTVAQKTLSISAKSKTKTYGSDFTFNLSSDFVVSGLEPNDAVTFVMLVSLGADQSAHAGNWPIEASGAFGYGLDNYILDYIPGTLVVNPKTLDITAGNATKAFGLEYTFDPISNFIVNGLVSGDEVTSIIRTSEATAVSAQPGSYPIIASGAAGSGLGNYYIVYHNGTMVITLKTLTITANSSITKTYGSTYVLNPTSDFTSVGLEPGDVVTSVTLTSAGTVSSTGTGTYPIVASNAVGTGLGKYYIVYNPGSMTVMPKTLTISAASRIKTYGTTATFAGTEFTTGPGELVNGDNVNSVTLISDGSVATAAPGQYDIVPSVAVGAPGTNLGNYNIGYVKGTMTVQTKPVANISVTGGTFTYNGSARAASGFAYGTSTADVLIPDVTFSYAGTNGTIYVSDVPPVSAGSYLVTASFEGNINYSAASATAALTISKAPVNVSLTANNKVYDGNTSATILATLNGVIPSDLSNVSLTGGTATFDNKNAGAGKTITLLGASLTGTAATNYTLSAIGTATAAITPLGLTGNFTAASKVYDGTTNAIVTNRSLTGVLAADLLYVSMDGGTGSFIDKNIGTGKAVTLNGAGLTGAASGNYILTSVTPASADITALAITGSFTAGNKVYDKNTTATVLNRTLNGIMSADLGSVSLTGGTASFATASVGNGISVTLNGAGLSGISAGNYTLSNVQPTAANITKLDITGTFTAANKAYDGTTTATITGRALVGVIGGDDVTLTGGTATFATAAIGNNIVVTATGMVLSGTTAGNYNLVSVATTTANITAGNIVITITPNPGQTKVYGAGNPVLTYTVSPTVPAGTITGSLSRTAGENVGTYAYNLGTLSVPSNYTLTLGGTSTFSITPKTVTGSITASNKVYDGTTAATVTRTLTGVLPVDAGNVILSGNATFSSATVGNNKTVTLAGATLTGSAAGNYTLLSVGTSSANITRKPITGNFTVSDKVYNRSTSATVLTRTLTGVVGTDAVALTGGTATFNNRNAGTGKTVTLSGYSLTGSAAGNYTLTGVATTTATITPKVLTVNFTAASKVYDGTNSATTLTRTLSGVISGDNVTLTGGTATFNNANAGTGKLVTLNGATLTGSSAANYALGVITTTASITAKSVTGSFTAANKPFDGNTTATILSRTLAGVIGSDNVSLAGGTASFASASVGNNKVVTATGMVLSGTAAGNYTLASVATTTANITPRTTVVTITPTAGQTKVYGSVNPVITYTVSPAVPAGTISGALSRAAGENVGTYAYTLGSLSGGSNYTLVIGGSSTFSITARPVVITPAANQTKVYGLLDPVFIYSNSALVGTDHIHGLLGRATGENIGTYAYNIGTLTAGSNYSLSVAIAPTFSITPLAVTVTANNVTKLFGTPDPPLTYVSVPAVGSRLANGDLISFSGLLTRASGERANRFYPIRIGTLGNPNYTITFTPNRYLTITFRNFNATASPANDITVTTQSAIDLKAYPNPFTDRLFFDMQLQKDAKVVIEIYNSNGLRLATVFNEDVTANTRYHVEYIPKNVASGMLVYRVLVDGKLSVTGKAIYKN